MNRIINGDMEQWARAILFTLEATHTNENGTLYHVVSTSERPIIDWLTSHERCDTLDIGKGDVLYFGDAGNSIKRYFAVSDRLYTLMILTWK
jgi:hypothetical protein